ncbi:hypothetical protein [Streptomyces sp. NRRL S-337]|uniref:hypothetical protein n=1 Tax=Streptomyces sp. NRRL S-337 TaxID=1463900 RepID=UPI00131ABF2B|nr:hypothetical protein [Streptomyces sp. NRRL S-337]
MTASMTSVLDRPSAGLQEEIDRIEREDGNEPEGADELDRLHAEVRHRLRTADARITASRRAPRTLDAMRDRLPLPPVAATEEDLNRELDNPAEDWDQAVPHTVLPQAAADGGRIACIGGGAR